MEDFWKFYNEISLNSFEGKDINYSYLLKIHQYLFGVSLDKGARDKSDETINKVDKLLQETCFYLGELENEELIIYLINRCISLIYMYQLFYDGNRRTCLVLHKLLLEKVNLKVRKREKNESLNSISIAIFYDETDEVSKKVLTNTKNMIENG